MPAQAGWLAKQRNTRPAVAAVFVEYGAVVGDPSSWAWLVTQLDVVRTAARSRNLRVVVVVVLPSSTAEVPEDRASMICRQVGIDRRSVGAEAP